MNFRAFLIMLSLSPLSGLAQTGVGNSAAAALSQKSPAVQTAQSFLVSQAQKLQDSNLRKQTLDAIANPATCVVHRANLTPTR